MLIGLIVCTAVIWRQTGFARKESLRLDSDQMLLIQARCGQDAFETEAAALPGVAGMACSTMAPLYNTFATAARMPRGGQTTVYSNEVGFGFMFAPNYHSARKHAAPVRKEMGVRTLFNILGPLTNPAGARQQLMGVFHPDLVGIQARVLQRLGSKRVLVVHGEDGMDEITISGNTLVAELKDGVVTEYIVHPSQFGLSTATQQEISVDSVQASRDMLLDVLDNRPGAARDIVLMNAGAAIYLAGMADTLPHGVTKAAEIIASGAAKNKLEQLIHISNAA